MQQPTSTQNHSEPPSITLDDILFILFRHKWKILVCALVGIVGAGALFFLKPPVYTSEAKLIISYVVDSKAPAPTASESQARAPGGDNILTAELEILTSMDVALKVADQFGPERILAELGGGTNRYAAGSVIRRGLTVELPRNSNVILVMFSHRDPTVVQPVLELVVDEYIKRHLAIHQGFGAEGFISEQATQLRERLAQTETKLREAKTKAGVVSLEDTKKNFEDRIAGIEGELLRAKAELSGRKAVLEGLQAPSAEAGSEVPSHGIPQDTLARYRTLRADLDDLRRSRRQGTVADYLDEHPVVKRILGQIQALEEEKRGLERAYPPLATMLMPTTPADSSQGVDATTELMAIRNLEARIETLTGSLAVVREQASRVVEAEPEIKQLERQRDLEERQLQHATSSLQRAEDNRSLDPGRVPNIGKVQEPSPAARDSRKLRKPLAALLVGGLLAGIGLAFVIEFIVDRSIKRPCDLERRGLKVFLSIPDMARREPVVITSSRLLTNGEQNHGDGNGSDSGPPGMGAAPWDGEHELNPYFAALRDRLMTHFEVQNMNHKPKLVGLTSCNHGAGVSTMAAGLAAALSETGEGNVLLVDMNVESGAAYPFHWGKPGCGLSEVLQSEKPGGALVHEKLYMASAHENRTSELPPVLPKRFAHLVPKMKASDFDYIIFDMPPVSQTSVTPRLSRFMDMVLMVAEAEQTGQEILKKATALLQESGADPAAVLNKSHRYVPKKLDQEL